MQRWPLLAALVVLALLAAFLWTRENSTPARTPVLEHSPVESRESRAIELDAPARTSTASSRAEAAETVRGESVSPASASIWTGVRVRVTAVEDGRPLSSVRVRAYPRDSLEYSWSEIGGSHGRLGQSPSTDARGFAELELESGRIWLVNVGSTDESTSSATTASVPALAPDEIRELTVSVKTREDLVLHGRVVDRETNAPIPGARVGPSQGFGKIRVDAEQRTDANGRFRIEGASWRPQIVQVLATGYELAALKVGPGYANPAAPMEIALSRVASVRITATGADGTPIVGLRVFLTTAKHRFGRPAGTNLHESGWANDAQFSADTDALGRAYLADLPPRMPLAGVLMNWRTEVFRAPDAIALEPGELREVAWRVGAGCTIHGRALEESGAPAAGLEIALEAAAVAQPTHFQPPVEEERRSARTDADGRFAFTDVGPGDWWVGPAPASRNRREPASDDDPAPVAQVVQVESGASRVDVTVRVARGHTIRGRLVDPDGKPVQYAYVTIDRTADRLFAHQSVDAMDGSFVLGPLEPGEYVLGGGSMGDFVDPLPVTARTGDTGVVLQFRRGGCIAGIVLDADGKPAPLADVVVNTRVASRWSNLSSAAGDDGHFRFDGLQAGLYDVAARTASGQVGLATGVEVAVGKEPTRLRIHTAPGARVRVLFQGPWTRAGISVLAAGTTVEGDGVEKGSERTFAAPAGACVVRVTRYPEVQEFDLPLTLKAGETRDLVFDGAWK